MTQPPLPSSTAPQPHPTRRCAHCGAPALALVKGEDSWSMLAMNRPNLDFRCQNCGAESKDLFEKGAMVSGALVGAAFFASNFMDDGPASFMLYVAQHPGELAEDVLVDGLFGLVGVMVMTTFYALIGFILPLVFALFIGRGVAWRRTNPLLTPTEQPAASAHSQPPQSAPDDDAQPKRSKLRIAGRALLVGFIAQAAFALIVRLAEASGSLGLISVLATALLFGLLVRGREAIGAPLWLVLIFAALCLVPTAMVLDLLI